MDNLTFDWKKVTLDKEVFRTYVRHLNPLDHCPSSSEPRVRCAEDGHVLQSTN
jgi:hypothetical protein